MPFIISFDEWTLGVVLDIYWKFEEVGDHYLGHILYGLDTCSVDIGVLHTHFIVLSDNPLNNLSKTQIHMLLHEWVVR